MGGHNERTNLEIVREICAILDARAPWEGHRHEELVVFVKDRPGHDFRYAIDPEKIERELGWKPEVSFMDGIRRTVEWYCSNSEVLLSFTRENS